MYIKEIALQKEIIICQGRGKRSKKLDGMLVLIADNVFRKRSMMGMCDDTRYDIYVEGVMHLLNNWHKINLKKYNYALPYITEVVKRGFADGVNKIHFKKKYSKEDNVKFISLDYYHNSPGD